jgi:hypothetical protein
MRPTKKSWFLLTVALGLLMCQFGPSEIASAKRMENNNLQFIVEDATEEDVRGLIAKEIREPDLNTGERLRLAFPYKPSGIKEFLTRSVADDVPEWPEMHYMNEDVEHYGVTLRIVDYRLIHGKEIPTAIFPETDEIRDIPQGISGRILGGPLGPVPYIAIPPQTTLLMVKFEVEPELGFERYGGDCRNEEAGITSSLSNGNLRVAYPGLGETAKLYTDNAPDFFIHDYGEYSSPPTYCMADGWYHFYIADPDPDPAKIWVMHVPVSDPTDILLWTLIDRGD